MPALTIYSVVALALAAASAVLAGMAYRHRHRHGASWAAALFLSVGVWIFGYSMELLHFGVEWKLLWSQFQYVGITTAPVAWFWLAASHAGWARSRSIRWVGATLLVPLVTVLLAWTNGFHGLIWAHVDVFESGALSVATFEYGPWFGLHIVHSYILIGAGSIVLLRRVGEGSIFRFQALALLVAALAPWIGNLLHITRATALYPLDLTPFAFALSTGAVCVGLFQFELLQLVPAARDTVVESMQDGVLVIDDQARIVDCNPAATNLVGEDRGALVGADIRSVLPGDACLIQTPGEDVAILSMTFSHGDAERHCEVSISGLGSPGGRPAGSLIVLRDITRQKEDEAQIQFLALRDPLTGLPNRDLLSDRLEQSLARQRDGTHVAVLFLDLDDFKKVNDHYGHSAGDELLQQVAERILKVLRGGDTLGRPAEEDGSEPGPSGEEMLARFGGDEFVVLLDGLPDPASASAPARRILETICRPFEIEGTRMILGTSVGIAVHPQDGENAEALLRAADSAMYEAKRAGGGRYQFFTSSIDEAVRHRVEIEDDLYRALEANELEVYFQPQVDAGTLRPVGIEALLRWNHPTRGLLLPGAFLPVAERSSLILSIDAFVIDAACRQWSRMFGDRADAPTLALNVSSRRFAHGDLAVEITKALREHGIPPGKLEIEIGENALMEDTESTREALSALRELGVRMAIDDFGTGYSSLGYLMDFELDVLKVARRFVASSEEDQRARHLVEAVVAVGHALGLRVVGEGVETTWQRDFLIRAGCDRLQGYLFGWPMRAADLTPEDFRDEVDPAAAGGLRCG